MNRIIFRTDANHSIGMGHLMRCLSIADAFQRLDKEVSFIVADDIAEDCILERGFKVMVLYTDYKDMDDELQFWPLLDGIGFVIVDSYHVTYSYLYHLREKVGKNGGKLAYIDDVYSFPYPVDILINYNIYGEYVDYHSLYVNSGVDEPQYILGTDYVPLRDMFKSLPKRVQTKRVRNVLISTGGSDELHLARTLICYLLELNSNNEHTDYPSNERDRIYHVLLGSMNSDKDDIRRITKDHDFIILHENVSNMKSLIMSMDLCVSAAGSSLYEICACGVPLITYSIADNQLSGAEAFEKYGVAVNIGDLRDPDSIDAGLFFSGGLCEDSAERIISTVEVVADDYLKRTYMGKRMQELVDGYGASRIVNAISCLSINRK